MKDNFLNFNLPWNDKDSYWICVALAGDDSGHVLEKEFLKAGYPGHYLDKGCYAAEVSRHWGKAWAELRDAVERLKYDGAKVAVIGSAGRPLLEDVRMQLDEVERIDVIARNLWLGDAILEGRVECHFQPIIDRAGQVFGYESFVRLKLDDGKYIGGAKIIEAAKESNIHHYLDKYLHILAIKTFAEANLQGNLFVNFITGFIQLPQKYLEGLSEAAKNYGISPKRLALDISETQQVQDINQIVSVINYAESKGYSVALDDITSVETLDNILAKAHADYVKIERIVSQKATIPRYAGEIKTICEIVHAHGSKVLAEGIETHAVHDALAECGVDLFQGYHFGEPLPVAQIGMAKIA